MDPLIDKMVAVIKRHGWRIVFNPQVSRIWPDVVSVAQAAERAGYPYFAYANKVYWLTQSGEGLGWRELPGLSVLEHLGDGKVH